MPFNIATLCGEAILFEEGALLSSVVFLHRVGQCHVMMFYATKIDTAG